MDRVRDTVEKLKTPLLILLMGVALLLLTGHTETELTETPREDALLQETLSAVRGVGEVRVLLSDKGAVVVCRGADNAETRLTVIRAVKTYTGFGSDRIAVIQMS